MSEEELSDVWFAFPGDPSASTGGNVYARRLREVLPAAGWNVHALPLPASFPYPTPQDLEATRCTLQGLPAGSTVLIDNVAFGVMPPSLFDGLDLNIVALVDYPLALETGLSEDVVAAFRASERAALGLASAVIVTSQHTGSVIFREYGVPYTKLYVAPPGALRVPRNATTNEVPCLLTVGAVIHRKGPDVLVKALASIADLAWRSVWVGSLTRDPKTVAATRALIKQHNLESRITLVGELSDDALDGAYAQADLFVLPSRYEGYGMVFSEAMSRGIPVVACAVGAAPGTVPQDAGYLVPPDDPAEFAEMVKRLLRDTGLRQQLAQNARRHSQYSKKWDDTGRRVANALFFASDQADRKDHGHGGHSHDHQRTPHDHHQPLDGDHDHEHGDDCDHGHHGHGHHHT